jgi:hypothetical protein
MRVVRGVSLSLVAAGAFVAWQYYRAWHRRMERWHANQEKRRLADAHTNSTSTAAIVAPPDQQSSSASANADGASNFRALTELVAARYALLHQYAAALKHVRATDPIDSSAAASLDHVTRVTLVFDELDAALAENVYLRGLLKRISGSLKKTRTSV